MGNDKGKEEGLNCAYNVLLKTVFFIGKLGCYYSVKYFPCRSSLFHLLYNSLNFIVKETDLSSYGNER